MARLTTHVLDVVHSVPAADLLVRAFKLNAEGNKASPAPDAEIRTDANGRGVLLEGDAFSKGWYRMEFELAAYFEGKGTKMTGENTFATRPAVEFLVDNLDRNWHVPLSNASPGGYVCYRGS